MPSRLIRTRQGSQNTLHIWLTCLTTGRLRLSRQDHGDYEHRGLAVSPGNLRERKHCTIVHQLLIEAGLTAPGGSLTIRVRLTYCFSCSLAVKGLICMARSVGLPSLVFVTSIVSSKMASRASNSSVTSSPDICNLELIIFFTGIFTSIKWFNAS